METSQSEIAFKLSIGNASGFVHGLLRLDECEVVTYILKSCCAATAMKFSSHQMTVPTIPNLGVLGGKTPLQFPLAIR
jgi:hypothetical protein